MISSVKIENFVIVDQLEIDFQSGLIALTGETGAGKSVLVGAIDSVFGGKVKPGSLFDDSQPAAIELTVEIDRRNQKLQSILQENNIETEDNEIFFRKEIKRNLQARYFLNGRRISRQLIKEFRDLLLDFHSQRDQQKLFDNNYQLDVIDAFGELTELRQEYVELYSETLAKFNALEQLEEQEKKDEDRIKLYEFQLNEINGLKLTEGEDEKIQAELNLLQNSQEIINNSNLLEKQIYEDENSVYDNVNYYLTKFRNFTEADSHIKKAVEHLESCLVNLDEAVSEIQSLLNSITVDEARQTELETRMNEINRVKQKYKLNIPEILAYAEQMAGEMQNFSSHKEKIKQLKIELKQQENVLHKKADDLSLKRKTVALKLEKEIKRNIKALAIPQADLKIIFTEPDSGSKYLSGLNQTGKDEVEIYFTANTGIKVQPLKYAASGGELSRFLLVTKKILTDKLENKTIIFDEIDAGIGGKTAKLLGEFIHEISKYNQILCITHLAQIAVFAQQHYSIVKENKQGKISILISLLQEKQRKAEIARMMSGSESELALKYAEEIMLTKENKK